MNREEAISTLTVMVQAGEQEIERDALEAGIYVDTSDIAAIHLAIAALREQGEWVLVLDMTCPKCESNARPLAYPPELAMCQACGHEFAVETKYRVVEGK